MLILISDAFDAALPGRLAKYGEVTDDKNRLAEAEVVLIRSKTKVMPEYVDSAPKLKLVIRGGVGLDNVDIPYANSKGIEVYNTADASSIAVAELAFAMMIAMPNHITRADSTMRDKNWAKKELKRTELKGKTLGILGMGRIGSALASRAKAFDMKVIGYDCEDWTLSAHPVIEPEFSSMYMKGLVRKSTLNTIRSVKDFVLRPLVKSK